jgi:hypothetical protein
MLSDIVERNDGGMIVRDGEIERITESVDGREPFAHAPTKKRSVVYDDNDSPFHIARLARGGFRTVSKARARLQKWNVSFLKQSAHREAGRIRHRRARAGCRPRTRRTSVWRMTVR